MTTENDAETVLIEALNKTLTVYLQLLNDGKKNAYRECGTTLRFFARCLQESSFVSFNEEDGDDDPDPDPDSEIEDYEQEEGG